MSEMVLRTVERSGVDNNPRAEKDSELNRAQVHGVVPVRHATAKDRFAKPNWKPVMAVVTGASGWIGSATVDELPVDDGRQRLQLV